MNTKESIQKTFVRLYSKMDYSSITIKELCTQTPVARTTFYSYYSNIDELKSDIEGYGIDIEAKMVEQAGNFTLQIHVSLI